jgi:hypothetical protein
MSLFGLPGNFSETASNHWGFSGQLFPESAEKRELACIFPCDRELSR